MIFQILDGRKTTKNIVKIQFNNCIPDIGLAKKQVKTLDWRLNNQKHYTNLAN